MQRKITNTAWDGVADWYDATIEQKGSYQRDLILPNLLRLMGIKKNDTVLDIACGQGFFAREFFKKGARVIGVDASLELLAIAKKKSPLEIAYHHASVDALEFLKNESVDKATFVLAIQNIENVKGAFVECARVLRKNGTLFMVMNHPVFRIPQASAWGWDYQQQTQYRRIDQYISESKVSIDIHPGSKRTERTVSFHRPLQYYFKLLQKTGFCVERLEEWESHKKSQSGPRAKAEDRARKEIPLFLFLEAIKR